MKRIEDTSVGQARLQSYSRSFLRARLQENTALLKSATCAWSWVWPCRTLASHAPPATSPANLLCGFKMRLLKVGVCLLHVLDKHAKLSSPISHMIQASASGRRSIQPSDSSHRLAHTSFRSHQRHGCSGALFLVSYHDCLVRL